MCKEPKEIKKSKEKETEKDDDDEEAQNRNDAVDSLEKSFGFSIQILDTPPPPQPLHQSMESSPSISTSSTLLYPPLPMWSFSDDKKALKIRENHRSACKTFDELSESKEVSFGEFVKIFRSLGFDGSIHEAENEILQHPEARKRLIEVLKKAIKLSETEFPGAKGIVLQLIMAEGFKSPGCLAAHLEGIEDANASAEKFIEDVDKHQVPNRKPLTLVGPCQKFLLEKLGAIDMKSGGSIKLFTPLLMLANTGLCAAYACEVLSAMTLEPALDITFAPIYDCAVTLLTGGDIEGCLTEMGVQLNRWASLWQSYVPGLMTFGTVQKVYILATQKKVELIDLLKKGSKKKRPLVKVTLIQLNQQGYRSAEVVLALGLSPTVSFVGKSVTKPDDEKGTVQNFVVEKEDIPASSANFIADGVQIAFALDQAPSPATVQVTVNGMLVHDWELGEDDDSNFAVTFATPPDTGASIVVTYMSPRAGQRRALYLREV